MAIVLICPQGHRWELSQGAHAEPPPGPVPCFLCGEDCRIARENSTPDLKDQITSAFSGAASPDSGLPDIPGYLVLGRLGQGGMGVVYKAQQTSLNRPVALKMILTGKDARREHLVRFQIEAEALASLQHPNIVQIYEVGEFNNCPYLSLEYVSGGNLAQKLFDDPPKPEIAAELMESMARAIHAAHLRGVIHRDLKPGNILLHRVGAGKSFAWADLIPKITDFGLAKRLGEHQDQTQTGAIMGTPCYMAPEQARGDPRAIGPACDIYSLGTILYEILAGRPPFQGNSTLEIIDQVRSKEPTAPSRLRDKVPRDLEIICLKCLEKEPAKRYVSAEDLAKDLHRYREGIPIHARAVSPGERLVKWIKRRPAAAALIAVALVAVVVIASLSVWKVVGDRQAARAVADAYETSKKRLKLAHDNLNTMVIKVTDRWFDDLPDVIRQEILEDATPLYEVLAQEEVADRSLLRDKADALFRLGYIHAKINRYDKAQSAYRKASEILTDLVRTDDGDLVARRDLANVHNWHGELIRESGLRPSAEAEPHYRKAADLQEDLVRRAPENAEYRRALARSYYNLGVVASDTDRPDLAEQRYDAAVKLLADLNAGHELAECLINRGALQRFRGRYPQARADLERAIALAAALAKDQPRQAVHPYNLSQAYHNLGNLDFSRKEYEQALTSFSQSAKLLDELIRRFPLRTRFQSKLLDLNNSLASAQAMSKRYGEAEKTWDDSCQLLRKMIQAEPKNLTLQYQLGRTWGNLGWLMEHQGKFAPARKYLHTAVDRLKGCVEGDKNNSDYRDALAMQYRTLAEVNLKLEDPSAAAQSACRYAEVANKAQDRYFAACFLARCLPLTKQTAQKTDYAEQALEFLRQAGESGGSIRRLPEEATIFAVALHPEFPAALALLPK